MKDVLTAIRHAELPFQPKSEKKILRLKAFNEMIDQCNVSTCRIAGDIKTKYGFLIDTIRKLEGASLPTVTVLELYNDIIDKINGTFFTLN